MIAEGLPPGRDGDIALRDPVPRQVTPPLRYKKTPALPHKAVRRYRYAHALALVNVHRSERNLNSLKDQDRIDGLRIKLLR